MSVLLCLSSELDSAVLAHLAETGEAHLIVRRCADMVEVLAGARARIGTLAIISEDMEYLDVTTVSQLRQYVGVAVVASTHPHGNIIDDIRSLGDVEVLAPQAHEIAERIRSAKLVESPRSFDGDYLAEQKRATAGKLVAFWGPEGSHGRSSLVRDCSVVLAGHSQLLVVDGDTVSPSLAQFFDVAESSGLIGLARMIDQGRNIDCDVMLSSVPKIFGSVKLLAGMNTGQRWREISRPVADRIWPLVTNTYGNVVVDIAGGLDQRIERMDRWALTRSVVANADIMLHIACATPIGLRRLIEHWDALADQHQESHGNEAIVLTALRSSALGPQPLSQAREVLAAVGIKDVPVFGIRDERSRLDRALIGGQAMPVMFPKSGYSRDIARVCSWISDRI
ncbi:hypothetical protein [Arcanobacterium buesumense]|uniref:Uncharacterized protein n=1 Tax=Arcanobacterium buesumense TaxID=2722751 RepID=A0A6H2EKR9_9ACTO|nr:hypothetical protein [Arcanobacterium buesumense]QJC21327.1 hypothetical protein HC352_01525 [Arcanobacterium buesumense]